MPEEIGWTVCDDDSIPFERATTVRVKFQSAFDSHTYFQKLMRTKRDVIRKKVENTQEPSNFQRNRRLHSIGRILLRKQIRSNLRKAEGLGHIVVIVTSKYRKMRRKTKRTMRKTPFSFGLGTSESAVLTLDICKEYLLADFN